MRDRKKLDKNNPDTKTKTNVMLRRKKVYFVDFTHTHTFYHSHSIFLHLTSLRHCTPQPCHSSQHHLFRIFSVCNKIVPVDVEDDKLYRD